MSVMNTVPLTLAMMELCRSSRISWGNMIAFAASSTMRNSAMAPQRIWMPS